MKITSRLCTQKSEGGNAQLLYFRTFHKLSTLHVFCLSGWLIVCWFFFFFFCFGFFWVFFFGGGGFVVVFFLVFFLLLLFLELLYDELN